MKAYSKLFVFILLGFWTLSCRDRDKRPAPQPQVLPPPPIGVTLPQRQPIKYPIVDPSCQDSKGVVFHPQVEGKIWIDGELQPFKFPRDAKSGGRGLGGGLIEETSYGMKIRTTYTYQEGPGGRLVEVPSLRQEEILSEGDYFRLCQQSGVYDETTLEGEISSAFANLGQAFRFFNQLQGLPLPGLRLEVFPEMVHSFQVRSEPRSNSETYITDNAAYGFWGDISTIFIFPRSQRSVNNGFFTEFPLWQSPMVMSHEFAHHIFSYYLENSSSFTFGWLGNYKKSVRIFWGKHHLPASPRSGFSLLNQSEQDFHEKFLRAIDEGFADLFGFYSNGDLKELLDDHTCMNLARNIKSSTFDGFRPKILSRSVVKQFLDEKDSTPSNCQTPDYDDVHVIGAIFAYGIDGLLGERSPVDKAKLLLEWLGLWFSEISNQAAEIDSVPLGALDAMLKVLTERTPLSSSQCKIVNDIFSGLMESESLERHRDRWNHIRRCL